MKKWFEEEITFLNKNYSEYGTEYCVEKLNRSWSSVIGMATKLKLKAKKRNSLNMSEKEFLKINYPVYGTEYCMNRLNRSKGIILSNTHDLRLITNAGVKGNNIIKTRNRNNVNKYDVSNIVNIKNKFAAYILGFLWADGHVAKRSGAYLTSISIVKDDANFLFEILINLSDCWTIGREINKYWKNDAGEIKQAQNQRVIRSYSQELFYFLRENDYEVKSNVGFNKIFSIMSDEFKSYFILGLYDGDGHFNYQLRNDKYHSGEFVITSNYDYDWSVLENFLIEKNIEYSLYRQIVKLGRVSNIIIRKKQSLLKLYSLLYNDDFKGLTRKHDKFLKYINI